MCDGILLGSVCTSRISDCLCLFQGQVPGQRQGLEALQPPPLGQGQDVLKPPVLLDASFFSDDGDDGQDGDRAASVIVRDPGDAAIPPAAAGIFLFFPNLI